MHHAPVIGIEQPTMIGQAHLLGFAEDGHAGIVESGVETTIVQQGGLADFVHVGLLTDIGHHIDRFAASGDHSLLSDGLKPHVEPVRAAYELRPGLPCDGMQGGGEEAKLIL